MQLPSALLALLFVTSTQVAAQAYVAGVDRDAAYGIGEGTELVMVYFGASTCVPCLQPDFKGALEATKIALAERAAAQGQTFVALGVSLDHAVPEGLDFLGASGAFDEVAVGRNWFNAAALAHLWRPDGLEARTIAIPSVIVFERDMAMGDAIAVEATRYLSEVAGASSLKAWLRDGAPLE